MKIEATRIINIRIENEKDLKNLKEILKPYQKASGIDDGDCEDELEDEDSADFMCAKIITQLYKR